MHPEVPEAKLFDNPYQYTDYSSDSTHTSHGL